jgi:hypothetical protein
LPFASVDRASIRATAIFTDHQLEPAVRELIEFIDFEGGHSKMAVKRPLYFPSDLPKGKWCDAVPFSLGRVKPP